MKTSEKGIRKILLCLAAAFALTILLPICSTRAIAATTMKVSGTVYLKDLYTDCQLVLTGDTTIVDSSGLYYYAYRQIKSISGTNYNLTISLSEYSRLTIKNPDGKAINVKSLTHNSGYLEIYNCANAIVSKKDVEMKGPASLSSDKDCLVSESGRIFVSGKVNATSKNSSAIISKKSSVIFGVSGEDVSGEIVAKGGTYGINAKYNFTDYSRLVSASGSKAAINAGSTSLFSTLTITSPSNAYISNGKILSSDNKAVTGLKIGKLCIRGSARIRGEGTHYIGETLYCDITLDNADLADLIKRNRVHYQWRTVDNSRTTVKNEVFKDVPGATGPSYYAAIDDLGLCPKVYAVVTFDDYEGYIFTNTVKAELLPLKGYVNITTDANNIRLGSTPTIAYNIQKQNSMDYGPVISGFEICPDKYFMFYNTKYLSLSSSIPVSEEYAGNYIRAYIRAGNSYAGTLYSDVYQIRKLDAVGDPVAPSLSVSGRGDIVVSNAKADQEYIVTSTDLSRTRKGTSADPWRLAKYVDQDGTLTLSLPSSPSSRLYVFSRKRETGTHYGSSKLVYAIVGSGKKFR